MKKQECNEIQAHTKKVEEIKQNLMAEEKLQTVCRFFKVLGEPSRMKIVCALQKGELCVYHIVEAVGGTQSAVSHQLRILKDSGVIRAKRVGQNILYSIADGHVLEMVEAGISHVDCKGE
ncbi:MAG: winged helix-turn-helix transcriptional regulator [Clostridia bacterium]|nr:winged helix-turn-helix transcriptional regulator [Clostridia bacterium]